MYSLISTLLLFSSFFSGENDHVPFAPTATKLLKYIPASKEIKMEGAGHACYLDQTDKWHEVLEKLLTELYS